MSAATLLANELANLVSEAKRKNNELRNAADKSLQELRAIPSTSEQQLAADLSRRPAFIEPFLIACETRNPKLASGGVTCLQRLVIARGLPKTRLQETLNAFNACADLGLDIQLKVLQALPSLLQNYSKDLRDELLAGALQLCASLQSAKAQTVSGVAAATLQQLVAAVFEKVVDEDKKSSDVPAIHEVPGHDGPVNLRPAAYDAYRVFRDLVLAADDRPTKFVQLDALSPDHSLELVWSCLNANARLFVSHAELSSIIRSNLLPTVTRPLSEKLAFSTTVRSLRVMDLLLSRYFTRFLDDFEVALGLLTHSLDNDASTPWKRVLAMEVIRNFFGNGSMIVEAYAAYDQAEGGKTVVQDLMSAFVRLSSEKPAAIGLGQQSSVPVGPATNREPGSERASMEVTGGMAGMISSALGVMEAHVSGISTQFSVPRTPCLEQLDKVDAPTLPETYVYAMVLDCLNSLADTLARIVLPLTVRHDDGESDDAQSNGHANGKSRARSQSFRKPAVSVNPLDTDDGPTQRLRAVAGLVDACWPAFLATCSTYFNAALEEQYFRGLIKAYQRFAQVAGLLRLETPRDALTTTLSKNAIPPHVLNAAMTDSKPPGTPNADSPRVFSGSKNLLSVDGLVGQASTLSLDRDRRPSVEPSRAVLSTRNLLCLRALLNLAIALGPTMGTAFSVVVDALKQADMILSSSASQQVLQQSATRKGSDTPAAVHAFSTEVSAVESAASRLLESTADFPNDAFQLVLQSFIRLLSGRRLSTSSSPRPESASATSPPPAPWLKERTFSGLPGISTLAELDARDYQFVLPKLATLGHLNTERFIACDAAESGWSILVDELVGLSSSPQKPREARRAATEVICSLAADTVVQSAEEDEETRIVVQRRALAVLLQVIDGIYSSEEEELTNTDLEIQKYVLDALRAILERSGESLIAGWIKTLAIISSTFERTLGATSSDVGNGIEWDYITSDLVSAQIGRVAFSATQLVCSDFLSSLPKDAMPGVVELLRRFMCQREDLNLALTAVTIMLAVADYLIGENAMREVDALAQEMEDSDDLLADVRSASRQSRPAQLVFVLLELQRTIGDTSGEVRNAAFQTFCSIFKNHGDQLGTSAWDLLLRAVVLRVAANDIQRHMSFREDKSSANGTALLAPEESASVAIMIGISEVIAHHLRAIEQTKRLPSLFEIFLNRLESYVDVERNALNAAAYTSLSKVLSRVEGESSIWTTPVYRTMALWLKRIPEADGKTSKDDNQGAYLAYVEAGAELYRLAQGSMSPHQTRKFVDNLRSCVAGSDGPRYRGDATSLSPLQSKVMALLRTVRTDQDSLPSTLIKAAAQLSTLHHESSKANAKADGPTFIAISHEAVQWLSVLLEAHLAAPEVLESGAALSALRALRRIVVSKYQHPAKNKETSLWRRTETVATGLSTPLLDLASKSDIDGETKTSLWAEYVAIAGSIVSAAGLATVEDAKEVYDDQLFDMAIYTQLRQVLIPRLGDPNLPNELRIQYCRSLFEASIVHAPERGEVPPPDDSPLNDLQNIRRGRADIVPYTQRERMSYMCFAELLALASPGKSTEQQKLAEAAAPLCILRLAIPIRAYIADQPLRGRSPQPLSELEELLFCFERIGQLRLQPNAVEADVAAEGGTGTTAHLRFLYPLLIKAVKVAGNRWYGHEEVLMPLQAVLETVVPMP